MQATYVPLLATARGLLDLPRDMTRFREYVRTMTGGTGDAELLPLVGMNPMSKPHVAARLDEYLALGADVAAARVASEAAAELRASPLALKVGLVVADDVAGGWTDRHLSDAQGRFELAGALKRGWAVATLWASEPASIVTARVAIRAALYRTAHAARFGEAKTLGDMMRQEGRAARFAGAGFPDVDAAQAARVLVPHRDATLYATRFAAMYGDEAACKCGYPPLGVPAWGGFALALREADDPTAALR